jgi:hypothetical protein
MKTGTCIVSFPDDSQRRSDVRPILGSMILLAVLLTSITNCSPHASNSVYSLNDRTIHLLLSNSLVSESDDPDKNQELKDLAEWIQNRMNKLHSESFELKPAQKALLAVASAEEFQMDPSNFDRLSRLNRFFVNNNAVAKGLVAQERIKRAILHPSSVSEINRLIELDQTNKFSETGGIFAIDPNDEILRFLEIKSNNQVWAERLFSARTNVGEAISAMKSLKNDPPYMLERTERTIEMLSGGSVDEEKLSYYQSYLDLFLFYSKSSYILNQDRQFQHLSRLDLPGVYLGLFHVHPPENTPSPEDYRESLLRRNLVIVPIPGSGFDAHYVFFGSNVSSEPQIIRYRKNSGV